MQDFNCTKPDEMHYNELAERVGYIKNTKAGEKEMSDIFELVKEEGREEGREEEATRMGTLMSRLYELGRKEDADKAITDSEFRNSLYKELGIA